MKSFFVHKAYGEAIVNVKEKGEEAKWLDWRKNARNYNQPTALTITFSFQSATRHYLHREGTFSLHL
jgi:hypothetical protein